MVRKSRSAKKSASIFAVASRRWRQIHIHSIFNKHSARVRKIIATGIVSNLSAVNKLRHRFSLRHANDSQRVVCLVSVNSWTWLFLTTFSRADEISSSMSRRKPGNYLIDRQMLGWKCKELENNGDFVVHWPCLHMSLCRRKICLNDKKQVIFSFLW